MQIYQSISFLICRLTDFELGISINQILTESTVDLFHHSN